MSEPIYTTIEIGGNLSKSLIDEFIRCLYDDLSNMGDVLETDNIESFVVNNTFSCNGFADWGSCNETKEFCIKNNLSYIEKNEATGEYEATVKYKLPEMDEEKEEYTDTNHHLVIRTNDIKPYIDFLLKLTKEKDPKTLLALYINDPVLKDTVALCYKYPEKIYSIIAEKIKEFLPPEIPELPDFIIK
jgi:hypothetical protein